MCGFVGEMIRNGNPHIPEKIWKQSLEAIHHRGPDSTGEYKDNQVRLGFKRLSIIDLENGHQPLAYEQERYQIIFNGEIYNYVELRADLIKRGYTFRTDSDTEVLLALYVAEGKEAVKKLRGMFAFAIWDTEAKELFCARDRFGIKPFYYLKNNERFYFASEQKSIMPLIDKVTVNQESLQHYTTFQYVPEPATLTHGLQKLLPGHTLSIQSEFTLSIEAYGDRSFDAQNNGSLSELAEKTVTSMRDSVEKHMRSDVPVGAFLSSGIDSTAIVALAKERHPNLLTFTVGFETNGYSEIDIAKETAKNLGVKNIAKLITPEEFIAELPNIMWHMDEPVADPAAVPLYFVAKEASKHVTVVLSGEGADELFGGYNIYREPLDLDWFKRIPKNMQSSLNRVASKLPTSIKGKNYIVRGTTPIEKRYVGNAFIFPESEKAKLLNAYNPALPYTKVTGPLYKQVQAYDDSTKMQYIDMHTWLSSDILVKADRMTMAHSLELRVPFLDKDVFALARTLPTEMKLTNKTTKYVLREAMKDIIPKNIVPRKKLGFPVPIRVWLKNELYNWAKNLIQTSETDDVFNKPFILDMLDEHKKGTGIIVGNYGLFYAI
ncbi:asparagine synthase (glutamine-hydrolyzing) [Bacillus sp. JCM 19041]|uniref:asparagine synthase (glutamine-hydrolyzing) n=1 Tax=Bacillus sp. JCM 19041 TaxID=1460637 RepID=UPI000B03CBB6